MPQIHSRAPTGAWLAVSALSLLIVPWSLVLASKVIEERRPADPQGSIEIVNMAGSVEVDGWDRSEVEVTGTAGDQVERVEVTSTGTLTSIHVESRAGGGWGHDRDTKLIIRVPAKSMLSATLISADFVVHGVLGDIKAQTVSGDVSGDVGSNARISTVSGGVRLTAQQAKSIEIRTISGDIRLSGDAGDVEITTVSGEAQIELATLTRGRFKSVSGNLSASFALAPDGQLESESVSGKIQFEFAGVPAADFDVQSFSGDIKNCFGPKPVEPQYGPGSRLTFKNGDGQGRVQAATKSGDIQLCVKGGHARHVSFVPGAAATVSRLEIPYVI